MMLTGSDDSQKLTKSLHYYVNDGKILNPRRGIYTKLQYNEQEMACSLFRPSYISLEYVLGRAGVVFQWDETMSCVSYLSRQVEIADKQYLFRKINPELWIGMEGIDQRDNVAIASAERAFLDMVYNKVRQILLRFGIIDDEEKKLYGPVMVLNYGKGERMLKVEMSTRQYD